MIRTLLVLGGAVALLGPSAPFTKAQSPAERVGFPDLTDVLDPKELAKAKFAAAHADPQRLAQGMLEAARIEYEAREKEISEGRGTLHFTLGAARRLLAAESAASPGRAGRLAALERYWVRTKRLEEVNEGLFRAQRIPIQDLLECRVARLDAEIWLAQAMAGKEAAEVGELVPVPGEADARLGSKELAQSRFAAARADRRELAQVRLMTARRIYEAREKEFRAGRGTLSFLLDSARSFLEAELAVAESPADRWAALERHWECTWQSDAINSARSKRGRIPRKDYEDTRYHRFEAEIWLSREKAPTRQLGRWGNPPAWDEEGEPLDPKELARARFRAAHADGRQFAQAKLRAAAIIFQGRENEFLAGRGTLEFLLTSARRLLASLQEVYPGKADRFAALERYWEHLFVIDLVDQERYEAGRLPIHDVMDSRYPRLQAEAWLAKDRSSR